MQLTVRQWLTPFIGGGKNYLLPFLFLALTILGACTTDPDSPESYDTRTATDSTTAAGTPSVVVDTTWADTIDYNPDGSAVFELPDSVPLGDAGNAA
jgi:hypothetical protein